MDLEGALDKNRWSLVQIGTGVLGLLVLFVVIIPSIITVYGNFCETARNRKRLALVEESEAKRAELKTEHARLDSLRITLDGQLTDENRFSNLLDAVNTAALDNGVEVLALRPDDVERGTRYAKQPLQLTLRGQYHALGRFVNAVEQLDHIIAVDRLALQAENMLGKELKASITLGVYSPE